MSRTHPARHLLRAKDLADGRYFEPLTVAALAAAAGLSPAHFSREFRRVFGESPHRYLLTRRLERAAALLRNTDRTVADICLNFEVDDCQATYHELKGRGAEMIQEPNKVPWGIDAAFRDLSGNHLRFVQMIP